MKKISKKNLRLNKSNVSKLNALNANAIFGGNIPTNPCPKSEACESEGTGETCTSSRSTVDFEGGRTTNC
jgi:hypothetical protein